MHHTTRRGAWFRLAQWTSALAAWALIMPWMTWREPAGGLDPSWRIALGLIVREHFVFGRDIIFSYGPLGYLATRMPIGGETLAYLLFDLLTAVLLAATLLYLVRRMHTFRQLLLLLVLR